MTVVCQQTCRRFSPHALTALVWRLFWTIMLLGHAPATIEAIWGGEPGSPISIPRIAILLLAQLLFILKIVDVRWLRVQNSRRTWLAICIGVALLHAGAIPHDGGWFAEDLSWQTLTATALSTLYFAICIVIAFQQTAPRAIRGRDHTRWRLTLLALLKAALPPRFLMLSAVPIHRAPPR